MDEEEGVSERIREILAQPGIGPSLRRFLVNTMFDSTFVLLGIIIGSALTKNAHISVVMTTILTTTVATGISTGVSIYEAERLEQSIRIRAMERSLLTSLEDTDIHRMSRYASWLVAVINFCAPLVAGGITLMPFLLLPQSEIQTAAWVAVAVDLTMLFVVGAIMGRLGEKNPLFQGARMAVVGVVAFTVCLLIGATV